MDSPCDALSVSDGEDEKSPFGRQRRARCVKKQLGFGLVGENPGCENQVVARRIQGNVDSVADDKVEAALRMVAIGSTKHAGGSVDTGVVRNGDTSAFEPMQISPRPASEVEHA